MREHTIRPAHEDPECMSEKRIEAIYTLIDWLVDSDYPEKHRWLDTLRQMQSAIDG